MTELPPPLEFLPLMLLQQGRNCYGQLYLADDALHFLCLVDESAAAAAVGGAVTRQFGLVGALVGGAVSGVKGMARDKQIAAALEKQQGLPLEERLKLHPLSKSFRKDEVLGFVESRWSVPALETSTGKLHVPGMLEPHKEALAAWCAARGLKVERVKRLPLRTKALLWLTPVWLVLAYALVALPWAVQKNSRVHQVSARYDQVLEKSKATWEALGSQPVGTDLSAACQALKVVPLKGIIGYVGAIPGDGDKGVVADYERFPRTVEVMDYQGEASVFTMELARYRSGSSFGQAWTSILTEAPTDWGRRVRDVYPLRDYLAARYLAVGRVRSFSAPHRDGYSGPLSPGRAELSVRVLDLESGQTACEGDIAVAFPPKGTEGSSSEGEGVREGVGAGAVLGLCRAGGEKLCAGAKKKAEQVAAAEPEIAAAPTPPAPVVRAAAKPAKPMRPAKSPVRKPGRRR